jgi:outer membrane lipoprotein-sorting protein
MKAAIVGLLAATVAAASPAGDYLREVARAQKPVSALRARFVQEKRLTIVRDRLRSSGTFVLARDRGIVWQVESPERLRIVITREGVFAGGTRVDDRGPAGFSPAPVLEKFVDFFTGMSEDIEREFRVEKVGPDRLRLEPRGSEFARWLTALEIGFDAERKLPLQVRLEEPEGDVTEVTFESLEVNPRIEPSAFAP